MDSSETKERPEEVLSTFRFVLDLPTRDDVWALYDLVVGRADALDVAEARTLSNLGSDRYRRMADRIRDVLDAE